MEQSTEWDYVHVTVKSLDNRTLRRLGKLAARHHDMELTSLDRHRTVPAGHHITLRRLGRISEQEVRDLIASVRKQLPRTPTLFLGATVDGFKRYPYKKYRKGQRHTFIANVNKDVHHSRQEEEMAA